MKETTEQKIICPHCLRPIENPVNWISVETELPEDRYGQHRRVIKVLVSTAKGGVLMLSRINTGSARESEFKWAKDYRESDITHWMPIPTAATTKRKSKY